MDQTSAPTRSVRADYIILKIARRVTGSSENYANVPREGTRPSYHVRAMFQKVFHRADYICSGQISVSPHRPRATEYFAVANSTFIERCRRCASVAIEMNNTEISDEAVVHWTFLGLEKNRWWKITDSFHLQPRCRRSDFNTSFSCYVWNAWFLYFMVKYEEYEESVKLWKNEIGERR